MFEAILNGYRYFFLQLANVLGVGWGIVALSFITSVLMAPLIKAVGGIVRRENEYQSVILPQIAEIKRIYSTDMERTLHIQRLYSRYGYSPLSAIKKVLPLFVQIPFLLLTYYMLKGTPQLHGVSFGILKDLGAPDALLSSFRFLVIPLNVLPFVMTFVNLLTVVSTPSFTGKDQINAACVSLLFLVLLYTAPSALLLYWTLNNVITCLKTLLANHAEGLKLLLKRIALIREFPKLIKLAITPTVLAYVSLALLIIALYMRLLVRMLDACLNVTISYWLMCYVLILLIWSSFFMLRNSMHGKNIIWKTLLSISLLLSLFLITIFCMKVFTYNIITNMMNRTHVVMNNIFAILFILWLITLLWECRNEWSETMKDIESVFKRNAIWLVLPIVIAVHYSFSSVDFKLSIKSVFVLCLFMLLPVVTFVALSVWAFRRQISVDDIFKIVVGSCMGVYLVPMISRETGRFMGYERNILIRLCLIFAVAFLLTRFKKRRTATFFVSLLGIMLLLNVVYIKCHGNEKVKTNVEHVVTETERSFSNLKCIRKNNVYLLVYDSYAHDIVLDALNIPHADIASILQKRGFTRYNAYSTGGATLSSMSSAFSIGGIVQGSQRSMLAGNNVLNDVLQRSGYKTSYVLCAYEMPKRGERMPGDSYFPSPQKIMRPELVLFPCILRGLLSQSANTFNSYTNDEWVAYKRKEIAEMGKERNYIYAHSAYPGHCVSIPKYRKSDSEEIQEYSERIPIADNEMKEDLDVIFSKDNDPLIIIASDHGAYLTVAKGENGNFTAADLLDRYGIQLFVRWPNGYVPTMQIDTLPNVFLETLICLTGNTSLQQFKSNGETLPLHYPKVPVGVIKNATIQIGPQKGQNLFEAAKTDFQSQIQQYQSL